MVQQTTLPFAPVRRGAFEEIDTYRMPVQLQPVRRAELLAHVWRDAPTEGRVLIDGQVAGAVGVSGVKSSEDAQIAKAGIAALG